MIWRTCACMSWHFEQSQPAVADPLPMFTAAPLPAFTVGVPLVGDSPSSQSDDTVNAVQTLMMNSSDGLFLPFRYWSTVC